jgi:glycosyltransferase involved in cell wall biosynthesis
LSTKPNILIFIDWFWPGYLAGGPVQSIMSLVGYLNEEFHFKIITTNRDLNSKTPYPDILPNQWIKSKLNCDIFYAEQDKLNYDFIKKAIDNTNFDKVYINSFFSKHFSIVPLQILNKYYKNKPIIFAPRGMLGEGALAIKKYKKQAFILYAKITRIHARAIWHATSEQEENEIKKIINPKNPIYRISNLPKKIAPVLKKEKKTDELRVCFMSRISEKKNLVFALEILKQIKNVEVIYSIYGPIEDNGYWMKCEKIISELPNNIRVKYNGSIEPKDIEKAFSTEQIMFLPTFNENFGHSIVESLLCGCPVIISDQTPWNDLEEYGAGYAIDLKNKQKFIEVILHYAKLNQQEFIQESACAVNYINTKINLDLIINQYKNLFNGRT